MVFLCNLHQYNIILYCSWIIMHILKIFHWQLKFFSLFIINISFFFFKIQEIFKINCVLIVFHFQFILWRWNCTVFSVSVKCLALASFCLWSIGRFENFLKSSIQYIYYRGMPTFVLLFFGSETPNTSRNQVIFESFVAQ